MGKIYKGSTYVEKEQRRQKEKKGISLKLIGWFITIMAAVISAALVLILVSLSETYNKVNSPTAEYMVWKETACELKTSSDELTEQARAYVITGEIKYMDSCFTEAEKGRRPRHRIDLQGIDEKKLIKNST